MPSTDSLFRLEQEGISVRICLDTVAGLCCRACALDVAAGSCVAGGGAIPLQPFSVFPPRLAGEPEGMVMVAAGVYSSIFPLTCIRRIWDNRQQTRMALT